MFITDRVGPLELLSQLLTLPASKIEDEFRDLGHNDHLCTKFRQQIEEIFESYNRHKSSVYDIQGFTDAGADVLIEWEDDEGVRDAAALQIKSYDEIKNDLRLASGKRCLIHTLNDQYVSAKARHRTKMFYIVLCGNGGKKHRDFVRRVCAKFAGIDDVKIITPGQAWNLYSMHKEMIWTYSMRSLCARDPLLVETQKEFESETEQYRFVAISAVVKWVEDRSGIDVDDVMTPYGDADDVEWSEQVERALQEMMVSGDIVGDDGELFELSVDAFPNLMALYFDAKVRYHISSSQMIDHLMLVTKSI